MKLVEAGGFDHLHMAFYKNHDIGDDKFGMSGRSKARMPVVFPRPHVHAWVNIKNWLKAFFGKTKKRRRELR